ncbi:peptidase inhibitor family I36 protein [Streptomyces sp. NPDC046465]|uniref:peptidase inhibitor family I36 protein n=1 Tax=Streptomyces sp. NPDC046465 TaxID=3155810 RepID=UPI0033CE34EB
MTITHAPAGRLGRLALAAGAALALFAALPMSNAYADANGTFYYHSSVGDFQITDPPLHECQPLHDGATSASNQTNATATLYYDGNCQNSWGSLQPGKYTDFFGELPHSVQFGS